MARLLPLAIVRRGAIAGVLVVIAVAVLAEGCLRQPQQGWQSLWRDRWQWESLGERGCWGHGLNLYQESLLVPLVMRGPGIPSGDVEEPVQLLDLAPTVLAAVRIPLAPGISSAVT